MPRKTEMAPKTLETIESQSAEALKDAVKKGDAEIIQAIADLQSQFENFQARNAVSKPEIRRPKITFALKVAFKLAGINKTEITNKTYKALSSEERGKVDAIFPKILETLKIDLPAAEARPAGGKDRVREGEETTPELKRFRSHEAAEALNEGEFTLETKDGKKIKVTNEGGGEVVGFSQLATGEIRLTMKDWGFNDMVKFKIKMVGEGVKIERSSVSTPGNQFDEAYDLVAEGDTIKIVKNQKHQR